MNWNVFLWSRAELRRARWILFVFCFALALVRLNWISMHDQNDGRSSIRGDAATDINTYSAVRYFYDFGFWKSKLRPIHNYNGSEGPVWAYTHSPALPDDLTAVWAVAVRSVDEKVLRIFPLLFSVFLFFFVFYFMNYWLPNPAIAFVSAALVVTSNYFVGWADTFHEHTYGEVLKWLYLHCLLLYYLKGQKKGPALALVVMSFLIANTSFELVTYMAVAVVGFAVAYESKLWRKIFSPLSIVLGLSFVGGFLFHMQLNALYFGGWDAAKQDLWKAFLYRTNQCEEAQLCGLTWRNYLELPIVYLNRIERFFMIPGYALVVLAVFAFRRWKQDSPELFKVGWILAASSVSWFVFMSQHAWVHAFTGRHVSIFFAWVVGYGLFEYLQCFGTHWKMKRLRWLHGFFIFYMVIMALTQQVGEMYWSHGFSRIFR